MPSGFRPIVVSLLSLTCLAAGQPARAQGVPSVVEGIFPAQLAVGQTTVLSVAMNNGRQDPLQSIEISPAAGVTVGAIKQTLVHQGVVWWEIPVTVAANAAPGNRTLVAVQPSGRTLPVTLAVTNHVPSISNLTVVSAQAAQPTVDLQFAAAEPGGTLGDAPLVWFDLSCGTAPELGVAVGKVAGGMVRVSLPNPRTITGASAPTAGPKCDLEVRLTDASKIESNTLKTTVEFK